MTNLAGHDLPSLIEAFGRVGDDKPVCFICYTIKGFGLPFAGHKDNHAGLMTPAQMDTFRTAMNVRPGHEWDKFEGLGVAPGELENFSPRACRSPPAAAPTRRRGSRAGRAAGHDPAGDVDAGGLRRPAQRARSRKVRGRRAHRHRLARRHRLDQSRPLGQPPRAVRPRGARRHLQERAHSLDLPLGILAQGAAYRARHRRDEPVHPVVGARAVARDQRRAAHPDRHALRSVHRARPRCAQLCLLPGGASSWWRRRQASRWRAKAAPISRSRRR